MENYAWKITDNRYVAFIDIMGFKNMVSRETHKCIHEKLKEIIGYKNFFEQIPWNGASPELVKSVTYSDSIMIFSKDEKHESLLSFIYTIAALMDNIFFAKIPFKGAMAYGEMTLDFQNSIFFGQPLIDAFLLHDKLKFYGIILHATAEQKIDKDKTPNIFDYSCPLKRGISKYLTMYSKQLTIYPTHAYLKNKDDEVLKRNQKKLFESIEKLHNKTSCYIRQHIDNTISYLDHVKNK